MPLRCDFQYEKSTNLHIGLVRVVLNQQHPGLSSNMIQPYLGLCVLTTYVVEVEILTRCAQNPTWIFYQYTLKYLLLIHVLGCKISQFQNPMWSPKFTPEQYMRRG